MTHYFADSYEADATTGQGTAYYPFNGMIVAMKKNGVLSYLHRDHLGSLVSATDASGAEQCSVRYAPFGAIRSSTGTLVTDRLYTGQIRDWNNDAFYFFKERYYDATIGKFQTADSVVPDPKSPRVLNRYAYALNNPIRLVDPTGHSSWDSSWGAAFQAAHNGQAPTQQDWNDFQFSLSHTGSGPNGTWSDADWQDYHNTGYLLDRTFYTTGNFQLYEPSDTTGINGDNFSHPGWSAGGNLAALPGVDFGTAYVRVRERITGTGTHIDVFVGLSAGDPQTSLRPTYSVWFGVPPRIPGAPAKGELAPYMGPTVRSPTDPRFSYAGGIDIPVSSGNAFRLALTVNPWAPGAFLLTGTTSFEFDL